MFRLWGKVIKNNKIIQDMVFENDDLSLSKKEKINLALDALCYEFDLSRPLWLLNNEREMPLYNRTTFYQDHFMESIPFNYLEIEIIEDDEI